MQLHRFHLPVASAMSYSSEVGTVRHNLLFTIVHDHNEPYDRASSRCDGGFLKRAVYSHVYQLSVGVKLIITGEKLLQGIQQ